jgi:hypothetical protein
MSTRTGILAIRLLNSRKAPEATDKELLKSTKCIWSPSRHQNLPEALVYQRRSAGFAQLCPVRLEVAESEKESDNIILQFWRRCVPLGILLSILLEEDMKAKCWDELIVQVLGPALDARLHLRPG